MPQPKPPAWLDLSADQHLWLKRLVVAAFVLVLLRGLLPPTGFAATVLLFDYDFGLIRRGLIGSIANLFWGAEVTRDEVYAAAAIISLLGLCSLLALCVRRLFADVAGTVLALMLVTSFALGGIVGATGYLDLLLLALTCGAMLTSPLTTTGLMARIAAAGVGMFVHEIMIAYFAVFLCLDLWLRTGQRLSGAGVLRAALPFGAALLALGMLMAAANLPKEQIPAFLDHLAAKASWTPDPEATMVLERRLEDNLGVMEDKRDETGYFGWVIFDGIPLAVMSIWAIWLNLRVAGPGAPWITRLLLVAAIIAPLSLNIVAYDVLRFGSASVLVGFLALISQRAASTEARDRLAQALTVPHVLAVIVIGQMVSVTQVNTGDAHVYQLPWGLLQQLGWL